MTYHSTVTKRLIVCATVSRKTYILDKDGQFGPTSASAKIFLDEEEAKAELVRQSLITWTPHAQFYLRTIDINAHFFLLAQAKDDDPKP
jgi:hypothetical protein